jgi:hypothetical protein
MKKLHTGALLGFCLVGLTVSMVLAFDCPALVQECNTLVSRLEKRDNADQSKVAQAKAMCAEAQKLHEGNQHADSVIKAGEAITLAGQAVK